MNETEKKVIEKKEWKSPALTILDIESGTMGPPAIGTADVAPYS